LVATGFNFFIVAFLKRALKANIGFDLSNQKWASRRRSGDGNARGNFRLSLF
jgi:hypothetical protein